MKKVFMILFLFLTSISYCEKQEENQLASDTKKKVLLSYYNKVTASETSVYKYDITMLSSGTVSAYGKDEDYTSSTEGVITQGVIKVGTDTYEIKTSYDDGSPDYYIDQNGNRWRLP
jgi:hypothetical protein